MGGAPSALLSAADSAGQQRRVAGSLATRGVTRGDRVAFLLGALRTGIVPVMLDPALTATGRAELLADAEPALVVDAEPALTALLEGPEADLAPAPLGRPMHYTSGTTGRRKGVWSGVLDASWPVARSACSRGSRRAPRWPRWPRSGRPRCSARRPTSSACSPPSTRARPCPTCRQFGCSPTQAPRARERCGSAPRRHSRRLGVGVLRVHRGPVHGLSPMRRTTLEEDLGLTGPGRQPT